LREVTLERAEIIEVICQVFSGWHNRALCSGESLHTVNVDGKKIGDG